MNDVFIRLDAGNDEDISAEIQFPFGILLPTDKKITLRDAEVFFSAPDVGEVRINADSLLEMTQNTGATSVLQIAGSNMSVVDNIFFLGDPDTGIKRTATDTIGFFAGGLGTARLSISSISADFTVSVEMNANDVHFLDNGELQFGTNTGGDVEFSFNTTDLELNRVTGSPDFQIDMPIKVTADIDEFSKFGPATTNSPTITDANDMLVATKLNSAASGFRRAGIFITEFTSASNSTSTSFGINAIAFSEGAGDLTTTSTGGGLVGGRYGARISSTGDVTMGGGVTSKVDVLLFNAGTFISAYGYLAEGNRGGNTNFITSSYNFWGKDSSRQVTNNVGFFQEAMTNGATTNVEFALSGAGMIGFRYVAGTQPTEFIESTDASHLDHYANTHIDFNIGGTEQIDLQDGALSPTTDNDIDLGTSSLEYKNAFFDGTVTTDGFIANIVTKTGAYTATADDHVIIVDANGGAVTITLPAAASHTGRIYHVKKVDSSANFVTIDGNSTETIDGDQTPDITAQYESFMIVSDGSNWHVI